MSDHSIIRWGIIGCGDVCEVKNGPPLYSLPGSTVTWAMRRDAEKVADFAHRHGIPHFTTDANELIDASDVDAVYIATPVDTHCDYALRVAAAGKACLVDKPMARSGRECDVMVKAFENAGRPLWVQYYRRGLDRFNRVKQLIDSGEIGRVSAIHYHLAQPRHQKAQQTLDAGRSLEWRLDVKLSGGGIVLDIGSHLLDVVDYMVGPLVEVVGKAANLASPYAAEDTVAMLASVGGDGPARGAIFSGTWDFAASEKLDELSIVGSKATIRLACFDHSRLTVIRGSESLTTDHPDPKQIGGPIIQTYLDELRGGPVSPSTGRSAARTSHVLDTVLSDYYGGRGDDFWDSPDTWPGNRQK